MELDGCRMSILSMVWSRLETRHTENEANYTKKYKKVDEREDPNMEIEK